MPGATPIYGFPYQQGGDPPAGMTGQQNLATAIEARIQIMNTLPTVQVFTTSGSYAKLTNLKFVRVHVQAGGGGSAGAGSAGAGLASIGAPGGGGEYATAIIPASSLTASTTVTVGSGGGGGVIGGSGSAGGASSFGSFLSAVGGGAGGPLNAVSFGAANGGNPGAGGGGGASGIYRVSGRRGDAIRIIGGEPFPVPGGDSHLGFGGPIATAQSATAGTAGQLYGGGASCSWVRATSGVGGSVGAQGIVVVESFF